MFPSCIVNIFSTFITQDIVVQFLPYTYILQFVYCCAGEARVKFMSTWRRILPRRALAKAILLIGCLIARAI